MANTRDLAENPSPSILLVGDSGTHKTYFGTTIPGAYFFDFDKGMAVVRGTDQDYDTFKDAPRGVVARGEGIYRWGTAWPAFIQHLNQIGEDIDKGNCPYNALCFDSLSTLSNLAMNYVLQQDKVEVARGVPKVGIQHWGAQMQLLETVMDQLTSWPLIKVVTAHMQRNTNAVTEVVEWLPLITGKLAGKLGIYFDEVWYTQVTGVGEDREFTLQTESYGLVKQAKTRHGVPDGTETTWEAVAPYLVGDGWEDRVTAEKEAAVVE